MNELISNRTLYALPALIKKERDVFVFNKGMDLKEKQKDKEPQTKDKRKRGR